MLSSTGCKTPPIDDNFSFAWILSQFYNRPNTERDKLELQIGLPLETITVLSPVNFAVFKISTCPFSSDDRLVICGGNDADLLWLLKQLVQLL